MVYDRFLIELKDGNICYTKSFRFLGDSLVLDVLRHERTFDNGKTWVEVKEY